MNKQNAFTYIFNSPFTLEGNWYLSLRKTQQIGTSRSGKSIIVAQFGDKSSPAVLVTGNVDGDYLVGTELAMRLIEDLKAAFTTTKAGVEPISARIEET